MLTCTRQTLFALLLIIPFTPLHAESKRGEVDPNISQEVDQLMKITGLKQMIDTFPQEIEAQINQQKMGNPNGALTEEESRLLFSHFSADTIYQSLKQHLSRTLDSREISTLLQVHDKPLMKRIVTAEVASSSIESQKEMAAFIAGLRHRPPSDQRMKMIQQLDRASMSTDSVIYIIEMMMLGMGELMMERNGELNTASKAQMEETITNTIRLIEGELRQQIIMSMHYIYRDFSDAEVMRYIEQLKSDENQHYTRAAIEGIGIAILDAFKQGVDQLLLLRNARAA